jgi:diketogulonate reductase-like aldo/keto reductase
MRQIEIPSSGEKIPILGQGTYGIFSSQTEEVHRNWKNVLRKGVELGMTHIDTAELYGDGYSEQLIGEVLKEFEREDIFLTTKMLPSNRTESQMEKAINNSLKRLGVNYVDLYLIHWLESYSSIKNIMNFFEKLIDSGKTRYIGVSNFSLSEFQKAQIYLKKHELITNQVKINIIEQEELKNLDFYKRERIILTAYTPLAKANLTGLNKEVKEYLNQLAEKYGYSPLQIALAWVINHENVIAIPRTSSISHLKENAKTADIRFTDQEIERLRNYSSSS